MCYTERVDLGRCKKCHVFIGVLASGKVFAEMVFVNNGKWTHNITIHKDTDDKVVVPKRKSFPDYVKKVLDVLSELVLPSVYYREVILN